MGEAGEWCHTDPGRAARGPATPLASELALSPAAALGLLLAAQAKGRVWLQVHHAVRGFRGDAGVHRGDVKRQVLEGATAVCHRPLGSG